MLKSKKKSSWNILVWCCQQVKFLDYSLKIKNKHSWEMLEMIMLNNLKALTLLQVNFITILLIELEIICMFVYVSLQLVKNSEIVLESSLLSSTNVQLIGSCLGPNKLWCQWLTLSYQASNNLIQLLRLKHNLWNIWSI